MRMSRKAWDDIMSAAFEEDVPAEVASVRALSARAITSLSTEHTSRALTARQAERSSRALSARQAERSSRALSARQAERSSRALSV